MAAALMANWWRFRNKRGPLLGVVLPTALGIGLLVVIINDGGQLVVAQVRAETVARVAAQAGADTWYRTHRQDLAKQDALDAAALKDPAASILSFAINQQSGEVTVTAQKNANTLVVSRVGFLKHYAVQGASDTEGRTE
jgi:hypothetical protein